MLKTIIELRMKGCPTHGFGREFPYGQLPIEFLDGLATGLALITKGEAEYTLTITVEKESNE